MLKRHHKIIILIILIVLIVVAGIIKRNNHLVIRGELEKVVNDMPTDGGMYMVIAGKKVEIDFQSRSGVSCERSDQADQTLNTLFHLMEYSDTSVYRQREYVPKYPISLEIKGISISGGDFVSICGVKDSYIRVTKYPLQKIQGLITEYQFDNEDPRDEYVVLDNQKRIHVGNVHQLFPCLGTRLSLEDFQKFDFENDREYVKDGELKKYRILNKIRAVGKVAPISENEFTLCLPGAYLNIID